MSIKDGGPAFPAKDYAITAHLLAEHVFELEATRGMALRDYFAAKAMQAMVSTIRSETGMAETAPIAEDAYKMADAMLAERKKK